MSLLAGAPDDLLTGWASWTPQIASWWLGQVIALEVPVMSGKVTWDSTRTVHGSLTLTVPRFAAVVDVDGIRRQIDWLPPGTDAGHPLERFGQELSAAIAVGSPLRPEQFITQIGRFPIQQTSEQDGDTLQVDASSRFQIIVDAGLTVPVAPRADGTLASEFRRLLPDGFSVIIDPALVDRRVPTSLEWADDRMAALQSIADAWPARMREDTDGNVVLLPPLPATVTPDLTLTDGEAGTVVGAPRSTTRAGTYNQVVARGEQDGEDTGRPPVQAVAQMTTGPLAVDTYNPVTAYYSSPLLTTVAQCQAAADTRLANLLRPARTITMTHVPDPRITIDTAVRARRDGSTWDGYVVATEIPLTAVDGVQTTIIGIG